jgi:hypothetical protein
VPHGQARPVERIADEGRPARRAGAGAGLQPQRRRERETAKEGPAVDRPSAQSVALR